MLTVAFLANEFPSQIERYVIDEIEELQGRGVRVVAGSVRRPREKHSRAPEIVLQAIETKTLIRAAWLCIARATRIAPLIRRIAFCGNESLGQRVKAILHTLLGAYYAAKLENRGVGHIHAHHGYLGSWIAMTAARLLGVPFSMTLYGSDLLLHGLYLDTKLKECAFCLNVSKYNQKYVLDHYPGIGPEKLPVVRLGVDIPEHAAPANLKPKTNSEPLLLLAVGRLHPVKDHAFLVRACAELHDGKVPIQCFIVGEGPEHLALESLIHQCGLEEDVHLLGYVSEEQRDSLYDRADVVVLTSRSEGIPVVLMEAMARGKLVLAPAITGIPELVIAGRTGFLYEPGSMAEFVGCLLFLRSQMQDSVDPHELNAHAMARGLQLDWIRQGARTHVEKHFNRNKNLQLFADLFLQRILWTIESTPNESPLLQQI